MYTSIDWYKGMLHIEVYADVTEELVFYDYILLKIKNFEIDMINQIVCVLAFLVEESCQVY